MCILFYIHFLFHFFMSFKIDLLRNVCCDKFKQGRALFFGICHLSFFNFFFSIILNLIKQCSTSCGDGFQYRSALCMDDQGASIPSFNCRGDPKTDVRACVPANDPCPSYQYRLGPLSTVSDNDNTETLPTVCYN